MNPPATDPAPRATLRAMWISFTLAPPMYAWVAYFVRPTPGSPLALVPPDLENPVHLALLVAALGSAVAGLVAPRFLAARARASVADPRALSDDDRASLLRIPLMVRWAMFDAVAVFGFVLVFVGAPAAAVIPFSAVAFALMALHPPTSSHLASLLGD